MSLDQIIEILQAAKNGKLIQFRDKITSDWTTASGAKNYSNMSWNFGLYDYRTKCEEPEELWVNVYDNPEMQSIGYAYTTKKFALERAAVNCHSEAVRYIRATDQTR
jgi:hypothetical protein